MEQPESTRGHLIPGWSPAAIRSALKQGAQAEIARKLGIRPRAVSAIVSRMGRSARVENEIARRLKRKREEIFGPVGRRGRPAIYDGPGGVTAA